MAENKNDYGVLYKRESLGFDSVKFDLILEESHGVTNKITDFPVEDGSNVNDHVVTDPEVLTVTGFITGAPIIDFIDKNGESVEFIEGYENLLASFKTRIPDALVKLLELAKGRKAADGSTIREPLRFVTYLRVYDSMLIKSLRIPKRKQDGESLRFNLVLKKYRTIQSSTVTSPNVTKNGTGAKAGTDSQVPETEDGGDEKTDDNKTALKGLVDGSFNGIKKVVGGRF